MKRGQTPKERALADRIARARFEQRDPTGEHHAELCELARDAGLDPCVVLDDWDERAAVYQYEGSRTRAESEAAAVEDVRATLMRRAG